MLHSGPSRSFLKKHTPARRRNQSQQIFLVSSLLVLLIVTPAVVAFFLLRSSPSRNEVGLPQRNARPATGLTVTREDGRLVYPYSVIPGGIRDVEELRAAIARDADVAQHYADFDLPKLRLVSLQNDKWAYVSYRVPDGIYWTERRTRLKRGEILVTDGVHTARARCGNRTSEIPNLPRLAHGPDSPDMEITGEVVPSGPGPSSRRNPFTPILFPPIVPVYPSGGGGGGHPHINGGALYPPLPLEVLVCGILGTLLIRRFCALRP
jgi:hypothetical protein